jgi:uncharacterized protein (TIGR03437 family)
MAPGLVQGAMQINVQIPEGATPGPAVPVIVTVGDAMTNTVTVAYKIGLLISIDKISRPPL